MPPCTEPRRLDRTDAIAAVVIGGTLVLRLLVIFSHRMQLAPDEALFWDWARHPDLGYAEKPPMVAWVIALTRAILGDTEAGVRLSAPFFAAAAAACVYELGRRIAGELEALLSLAVFTAMPLAQAGALLMTPDAPLSGGWAVALLIGWRDFSPGARAR